MTRRFRLMLGAALVLTLVVPAGHAQASPTPTIGAVRTAPDLDSLIRGHEGCLEEMATALGLEEEVDKKYAVSLSSASASASSASVSSALRSLLAAARAVRRPCSALRVAAVEAAASALAFEEEEEDEEAGGEGGGDNEENDEAFESGFASLFSSSSPLACLLTEISSDRRRAADSLRARAGALADALTESEEKGGRGRRRGGNSSDSDDDEEEEDGDGISTSFSALSTSFSSSSLSATTEYRWSGCAFEGARPLLEECRLP